jgi:hypothetical protein
MAHLDRAQNLTRLGRKPNNHHNPRKHFDLMLMKPFGIIYIADTCPSRS